MAKVYNDTQCGGFASLSGIVKNSEVIVSGNLVSKTGGFILNTINAAPIEGVSNHSITATSDNQTVAKAKCSYVEATPTLRVLLTTDDTIAQADEGKFYLINASGQTVDVATASTTNGYIDTTSAAAVDAVVYFQVKLEKFLTTTTGLFSIVQN